MKIIEMKQKRAALIKQMRDFLDKAAKENRSMTTDENQIYAGLESEVDDLEDRIKKEERMEQLMKGMNPEDGDQRRKPGQNDPDNENRNVESEAVKKEYRDAFCAYLRGDADIREMRKAQAKMLQLPEYRSLHIHTDADKGATLVPTEFEKTLIDTLVEFNVMRSLASVSTSSNSSVIPMVSNYGDASWIDEEGEFPETDDAFGQKDMSAWKVGRIVKISDELLQDSAFNMEQFLARSLGKSIARAEENAFVNGNGTKKPTGLFVGATVGHTAAAANVITGDDLIDHYHSLARRYRQSATWLMNDGTTKVIRKLKLTNGDYLWQPGLRAGEPDILLGRPVAIVDGAPNIGSGTTPIAFGDVKNYQILDRTGVFIQRLNELYATKGQVGFRGYRRTEGKLLDTASVKKIKMGV